MNENVKKIFEMLGVEPNEEFEISGGNLKYRVAESLTVEHWGDDNFWCVSRVSLGSLLNKSYQIIKKPWKPKDNERFYFYNTTASEIDYMIWDTSVVDLNFYKCGNCFKTKEEITPEVIEQLKAFYENDEVVRK